MKAFTQIFIMLFAGVMMLPSCTKVSEPYYTVKSVTVDTNQRTVLLEDYTGHLCVNCAPAATLAATLQDAYAGQVFVVSIHAGFYATPNPVSFPPYLAGDYRCATGNDWNSYDLFNINVNPKGMVNRRQYNGSLSFGPTDWNEAVKVAAGLPKISFIKVNTTYNYQSKILNTNVDVKFLENYQGKVNLTVCILEDDIYGGQLNNIPPDSIPIIKNFRFMHVLRGSLNGSFGEEIAVNPAMGAVISKSYTHDFTPTSWVPEHCSVIAFISDADSKEILHVAKSPDLAP